MHKIPIMTEEEHLASQETITGHMVDNPITIDEVMDGQVSMEEFVGDMPQEVQELIAFIHTLHNSQLDEDGKAI